MNVLLIRVCVFLNNFWDNNFDIMFWFFFFVNILNVVVFELNSNLYHLYHSQNNCVLFVKVRLRNFVLSSNKYSSLIGVRGFGFRCLKRLWFLFFN